MRLRVSREFFMKGLAVDVLDRIDGRPARILGVEDNSVNQFVLCSILQLIGAEVRIVENGEEAIAAWEQERWDLILMDIQMPVMDGLEATREIRRREAEIGGATTPIVAVTANVMTHQTQRYLAAGIDQVVPKPIDVSRLKQVIAETLELRNRSDNMRRA
jgi:CheY-like chemotaxis protein